MKPPAYPPPSPPSQPSGDAARTTGAADQQAQQQLDRLFGASLFGAWPESHAALATKHRRSSGRVRRRVGAVLLVAAVASAGFWLYRRGGAEQEIQQGSQMAGPVAALLSEGALDRLAQALKTLAPPDKPLAAEQPHLDLIVAAEAALYRYHDAAPERLARIEPFLSNDSGQPARLLARLTVISRPERVASLDTLVKLPPTHAQGSEYHALLATIHEGRGDAQAAHASWEQSLKAGPRWLPHRYLQCGFEARQRNSAAVAEIVGHMAQVAPDSPWTRLAQRHFGTPPTAGASAPMPPVAQFHADLEPLFQGSAAQNLNAARRALGQAFSTINGQSAFVLDVFKALRDAKADSLAMELTSYETWPRGNAWARNALTDLQIFLAGHKAAQDGEPADARQERTGEAGTAKKIKGKAGAKKTGKGKPKRSPRRK